MARRAVAAVNVAAIGRNVAALRAVAGDALVCAVVKADGYGHGAVPCARAALAHGASWLAVATAVEAAELRAAGLGGPVLVLGALTPEEREQALDAHADVVVWREQTVRELAELVSPGRPSPARLAPGRLAPGRPAPGRPSPARPARVHVKLDTGMGRLGTRDPEEALRVVQAVLDAPGLQLVGVMTHFATADERGDAFFGEQLARFGAWVERVRALAPDVLVHAANSAATLRDPAAHFDMVRVGVAVYGLDPFGVAPAPHGLEPALELASYVAEVKPAAAGESAGYGRVFVAAAPTEIATVPIGYGDGWRRGLAGRADVLVGGARRPLVGAVSMDNVTLDLGPSSGVAVGDAAVLVGRQGDEQILAEEVARRLGTINYEITCGLTARVPRAYHADGEPLA